MFGFTKEEMAVFKKLNTPAKIQDFLNAVPYNFEKEGQTCFSPRRMLRENKAHCMEGAMFAAAALRIHGRPPLVMDLVSVKGDFDHVVAVWKQDGCFGAISKTNHGVLRYREPIYRSIRELAMSYFHEYFLQENGAKTLRTYSRLVDLSRFDNLHWMTSEEDLWDVPSDIDDVRHFPILSPRQIKGLRAADPIERRMGELTDWKRS